MRPASGISCHKYAATTAIPDKYLGGWRNWKTSKFGSRRSWKFRLALIDLDFERIYFTFFPLLFLRSLKEKKNSTIILKVMIARKILYNSAEQLAHISCLRLCPTVGNKDTGIGSRFFATFLQFPRIIVHYRSIEVPGLSLFLL